VKNYKIPVFIPELACRHKCIFCNQQKITGVEEIIKPQDVKQLVEKRLFQLLPAKEHIEIAFFGGNFTGLEIQQQEAYLTVANEFVRSGKVSGIRVSTRPDCISHEILQLLKYYGVNNIELGVQSMFNHVLKASGRGHTAEDSIQAASMIRSFGFVLGLQMMTGLPEDTAEQALFTAHEIVRLGAKETRIYPLLVFRDTPLYNRFQDGAYQPRTIEETVSLLAQIAEIFEESRVNILRIGLHASESILNGQMVAGPWHPALGQLVYSQLWSSLLSRIVSHRGDQSFSIRVSSRQYPNAVGYKRCNSLLYPGITFVSEPAFNGMQYEIDCC
jgi:histone acetyltransferase (RNA polymerase elongator complex component)